MANEHILFYDLENQIPFTVADGTAITKGAVLALTDPMTAATAGVAVSGGIVAGVAGSEKIASDGVTKLGVYRSGIFKATCSGAVTAGDALVHWGNFISTAKVDAETLIGTAFETGAHGETIFYELQPITFNLA